MKGAKPVSLQQNDGYESIRDMLIQERASALARMEAIHQEALVLEFEIDGIPDSSYGQDQALTHTLDSRVSDIDHALARLDDGSYGRCASCGNEIPPRRLQALPFATLCVPCQSEADRRARVRVC